MYRRHVLATKLVLTSLILLLISAPAVFAFDIAYSLKRAGNVMPWNVPETRLDQLQRIDESTPLTIDDLINIALKRESSYQKSLEDIKLGQFGLKSAWGQFLPSLSASANYGNNRSAPGSDQIYETINPVTGELEQVIVPASDLIRKTSSSSIGLSATEYLYQGGQRFHTYKKAKMLINTYDISSDLTRLGVSYSVKTAAYNVISAKQYLEIVKEVLSLRKENLRFAQTRLDNGDVIELEVMQAAIDVNTAENNVLEAEQALENSRERLNLAMGIDLRSRFEINEKLDPSLPILNDSLLFQAALLTNPEFKSLELNQKMAAQDVKISSSGMMPSVWISGSWGKNQGFSDYNKFVLTPDDDNKSINLGASWTLFNRFQNSVQRQNAVVSYRKSMWDKRSRKQAIASTLRTEYRTLVRLFKQLEVTNQNRNLARRQLELEQERYRLGATSQLSLRSAEVTFVEAENTHISKMLEYYTTLAALERDLGRSLEEVAQ